MTKRERVVEWVKRAQLHTTDRGCTPVEAAGFAAKAAEWIERYQIEEAELREGGPRPMTAADFDIVRHTIPAGAGRFNAGVTAVVSGLAGGMCCRIVLHPGHGAYYAVVGEAMDAEYVVQMAGPVLAALRTMARDEGRDAGRERAGLVRWVNQYLAGAGPVIRRRLLQERRERSEARRLEHAAANAAAPGSALICVTGELIAAAKGEAVDAKYGELYPHVRSGRPSSGGYDAAAAAAGRRAGERIGLHKGIA